MRLLVKIKWLGSIPVKGKEERNQFYIDGFNFGTDMFDIVTGTLSLIKFC